MKKFYLLVALATLALAGCSPSPTEPVDMRSITNATRLPPPAVKRKTEVDTRAQQWLAPLNLNDPAKEDRLVAVIATHINAVRDWHNQQIQALLDAPPATNAVTGKLLTPVERQVIADAAMPKSIHEDFMNGLRKDLTPAQVEVVLDKYTSGRVGNAMQAYHAIVPDLTPEEEATLLDLLKQAREESVGYKSREEVTMIFERYKARGQEYLISKGRDWKALYETYAKSAADKKPAVTNQPAAKAAE